MDGSCSLRVMDQYDFFFVFYTLMMRRSSGMIFFLHPLFIFLDIYCCFVLFLYLLLYTAAVRLYLPARGLWAYTFHDVY